MLGLPAPTPSSPPYNGNDYAVGGAKTGSTSIYTAGTTDLPAQVQAFENAHPGGAPSSALYTFEIGGNDVLYVLEVLAAVPTWDGAQAVLDQAALNIASAAGALESDGAKNLLLYNVPDLGLMPYVEYLATTYNDPTLPGQAAAFSQEFNTLVSQDLASMDAGLSVHTLDAYDLTVKMAANPGAYGLTDGTDACWTGGTTGYAGGDSVCSSPDTYLFWDAIHFSATTNEFIADAAFQAVVPEPSTWAMMLIGLAGLGFAGARRARFNSAGARD
jgi:phospholipase/lecithinase/hemolysin